MAVLNVIDRQGRSHEREAVEGWRVVETLRDEGIGAPGEWPPSDAGAHRSRPAIRVDRPGGPVPAEAA